jgi:hypothetical protein
MSGNILKEMIKKKNESVETKIKFVRKKFLISGMKIMEVHSDQQVFPMLRYVPLINKTVICNHTFLARKKKLSFRNTKLALEHMRVCVTRSLSCGTYVCHLTPCG